jgi:signal transduction histidine kinase
MVDAAPRSAAPERPRSGVRGSIRGATPPVTQARRGSVKEEPGTPQAEEPKPREPLRDRVRRSPARLWDAYLHNRTVRVRVITLLAVPLLAASLLGGLLLGRAVQDAIRADHTSALAQVTRDALVAAEALQDERDTGALHSQRVLSQEIQDARATADAALKTLQQSIQDLDTSGLPDQTESAITNVERRLDDVEPIRQDQDYLKTPLNSTGGAAFSQLIRSIIELSTHIAADTHSAREVEALTALAEAADLASSERGLTAAILAANKAVDAPQATELATSQFSQDRLIDRALDRVQDAEFRDGLNAVRGPMFAARQTVKEATTAPVNSEDLTAEEWYTAATDRIDVLRATQGSLVDMIVDEAARRADRARLTAYVTLGGLVLILVLAIALTLAVAGSIVRPLQNLQRAALRIAKKDLPELVNRVRDEGPKALRTPDAGIRPESNDEIGAVASAFNDVYATAVQVTGQQALLRQNLDTIVVNLSRRTQTLVDRQLREIEQLEGSERDPDQLATLFRVDHLATRVQRHAESLLVLAGVDSSTKTTDPVALLDVVRAAAGEVEQYDRVRFGVLPTDLVAAKAVDDVAHLIAELLDNATEFSPPATTVLVDCQRLTGGKFRITVADQGLGIPPSRLTELNERLQSPGDIDVAASRTLGLYVVARLASRHGISVRLEAPAKGGTIAVVDLPASVMAKTEAVENRDQGTAAAAEREAPAAGRPQTEAPSQPVRQTRPPMIHREPGREVGSEPDKERRPEPQPQLTRSGLPRRGQPSTTPTPPRTGEPVSEPPAPAERTRAQEPTPVAISDPLTDPRLRRTPQRDAPENETPIYSALRSFWFRRAATDGAVASPDEWTTPADEGWRKAAAVSQRTEALSALPRNGTATAPEVRRPAAGAEDGETPHQGAGRPSLPSRMRSAEPSAPPQPPVEAEPARTQAGLPLRQRGAALVPGAIAAARPTEEVREASAVRSTLSTLVGGVTRGREEVREPAESPTADDPQNETPSGGNPPHEENDA